MAVKLEPEDDDARGSGAAGGAAGGRGAACPPEGRARVEAFIRRYTDYMDFIRARVRAAGGDPDAARGAGRLVRVPPLPPGHARAGETGALIEDAMTMPIEAGYWLMTVNYDTGDASAPPPPELWSRMARRLELT